MRSCWPILAILCVVESLLVPAIASASTAPGSETRVGAFGFAEQVRIGGSALPTLELHSGCELAYDQLASDSLLAAKGAVDGLGFTRSQLQHAFKHSKDFGVTGNANNKTLSEFSSALQSHVDAAGTRAIQGTYRGNPVTHHVDPGTGLNVIRDSSGNFLSDWKLSPQQLQHVLTTGKLGGG